MFLDLEEGVRDLFLDAQQPVFDAVRAAWAVLLQNKALSMEEVERRRRDAYAELAMRHGQWDRLTSPVCAA